MYDEIAVLSAKNHQLFDNLQPSILKVVAYNMQRLINHRLLPVLRYDTIITMQINLFYASQARKIF